MIIARRGLWNHQNKVIGIIRISSYTPVVIVDVMKNSKGVLVLCNNIDNVDDNNDTLEELCNVEDRLHIILEIKKNLATEVLQSIKGSKHEWELCSYDYMCVKELCKLSGYKVGLVTTSAPHSSILNSIDFVSQDYDFYSPELLELYKKHNLDVYIFNTQTEVDGVDGIIKNILLDILI